MDTKRFCHFDQEAADNLQAWFGQYPGRALLEQETACLNELLPQIFGYYLVQLGMAGMYDEAMGECRVGCHLVLASNKNIENIAVDTRVDMLQLPIATESVDAVLVPHTLDFTYDPHRVLREIERILIPEGRILITGFNPWSVWGIYRLLLKRKKSLPWCAQFISIPRLQDWLRLLDFNGELIKGTCWSEILAIFFSWLRCSSGKAGFNSYSGAARLAEAEAGIGR
ncbi:MAG: class I SAM-dependent methyltransferase [Gammaproteobacteria bacterium]